MIFHIQPTHLGTQQERATAKQLTEQYTGLDFQSPNHLVITLRDQFESNGLDLQVNITAGVVNVISPTGIILRFRSPN